MTCRLRSESHPYKSRTSRNRCFSGRKIRKREEKNEVEVLEADQSLEKTRDAIADAEQLSIITCPAIDLLEDSCHRIANLRELMPDERRN